MINQRQIDEAVKTFTAKELILQYERSLQSSTPIMTKSIIRSRLSAHHVQNLMFLRMLALRLQKSIEKQEVLRGLF